MRTPLYTGHSTRSPRCSQWRSSTVIPCSDHFTITLPQLIPYCFPSHSQHGLGSPRRDTHQGRLRGDVEGGWPFSSRGAGGSGGAVAGGTVSCMSEGGGGHGEEEHDITMTSQRFLSWWRLSDTDTKSFPKETAIAKTFMVMGLRF